MERLNLSVLWLAPLLWALVLLMMSVENPFSIAFSTILLTSQVPLTRWILARDDRRPIELKTRP